MTAILSTLEYLQRAAEAINRAKRRFLVEGVQCLEVDDPYKMSLFREGADDGGRIRA